MRGRIWGYFWCAVLAVLLVALLREAWVVTVNHVLVPDWQAFSWSKFSWSRDDWASNFNVLRRFNFGIYWWFAVGTILYPLIRWLWIRLGWAQKRSFTDMETLSHELSHWIVGKLLGRRMHSVHAGETSGEVTSSGAQWSRPFMSLAPYTMPFLTYAGLALRALIIPQRTWLFDILVGLTFGFHLVCFAAQTRKYQTDINRFSTLWFPFLFIAVFAVFNFNVIAVSFWTGSHKNFFTAIWWVITHLFAAHIP